MTTLEEFSVVDQSTIRLKVAIRSGLSGSTIMKHIPMPMKMCIIHTTLAMNNQIHAPHR
jgi:hypothetical protein